MNQLIERVLTVGSWLTPVDGTCVFVDGFPIERDMLPVAFHRQLLQIGGKAFQVLFVRQYSDSVCTEEIVVRDSQQSHENRQICLKWRRAEVLIHFVEAAQHGTEVFG